MDIISSLFSLAMIPFVRDDTATAAPAAEVYENDVEDMDPSALRRLEEGVSYRQLSRAETLDKIEELKGYVDSLPVEFRTHPHIQDVVDGIRKAFDDFAVADDVSQDVIQLERDLYETLPQFEDFLMVRIAAGGISNEAKSAIMSRLTDEQFSVLESQAYGIPASIERIKYLTDINIAIEAEVIAGELHGNIKPEKIEEYEDFLFGEMARLETGENSDAKNIFMPSLDALARAISEYSSEKMEKKLEENLQQAVDPAYYDRKITENFQVLQAHGVEIFKETVKARLDADLMVHFQELALSGSIKRFVHVEEFYGDDNPIGIKWRDLISELAEAKDADQWYEKMKIASSESGEKWLNDLLQATTVFWLLGDPMVKGDKGELAGIKEFLLQEAQIAAPYTRLLFYWLFNEETVTVPTKISDIPKRIDLLSLNYDLVAKTMKDEVVYNKIAVFEGGLLATFAGCLAAVEAESLVATFLGVGKDAPLLIRGLAKLASFEANVFAFETTSTILSMPMQGVPESFDQFHDGLMQSNAIFLGLGIVGRATRFIEKFRLNRIMRPFAKEIDVATKDIINAGIVPTWSRVESFALNFTGTFSWLQWSGVRFYPDGMEKPTFLGSIFSEEGAESAANLSLLILMNHANGNRLPRLTRAYLEHKGIGVE